MIKKIALVGLGSHAKRIYYGFIKNLVEKGGKFEVLIELESKRFMVENFFQRRKVKPFRILYIPDKGQLCPKKINKESGNFKGVYFGQNELSRYIIFDKFLKRKFSDTMLDNQLLTNKILSSIYESYVVRKNVLLMV